MSEQSEKSSIVTFSLDEKIVETRYEGPMTTPLLMQLRQDMERIMPSQPGSNWLIDVTKVTSFSPAPPKVTIPTIDCFQKHHGDRIAVVMSSGPRMLVTAIGFASGIPMKVFDKRESALAWLRASR